MRIKFLAICCLMLVVAVAARWSWAPVRILGQTEIFPGAAERLRQHVRMLSEFLCPRDAAHPENLERAARYIREQFAATGARVSDQPVRAGDHTYRNVIASFGPEQGERVVVGAHYDAFSRFPGADDNASGVAGLLEVARLLRLRPPKIRVDLVAFTLEEPPYFREKLMGSAVYAQALASAQVRLRGMICLEMIGFYTDAPDSQRFPARVLGLLYPTHGNFLAVVGRFADARLVYRVTGALRQASRLPVQGLSAPRSLTGVDFSDHASFWDRGYPAVMLTDTAFYRNLAYHTEHDTADRLDYGKIEQVAIGVCAAVHALSAAR
jgi:Zn-dependent M28 family amino/carboxypeptidase